MQEKNNQTDKSKVPTSDSPKLSSVEKTREQLRIGQILVAKQGGKRYEIVGIMPGLNGKHFPYLSLRGEDGKSVEHDTGWDSYSATYTVEESTNEPASAHE